MEIAGETNNPQIVPPVQRSAIPRKPLLLILSVAILAIWLLIAFAIRPVALAAHAGASEGLAGWLRDRLDALRLAQVAGALQWASLAGLAVVLLVAHAWLARLAPAFTSATRGRFAEAAVFGAALIAGYLVFVWTPVTAVSLMVHDNFMFYDAIHRIDSGLRPSIDFPSPFGAAMLYPEWLGARIAGGNAGAIEMANAIVSLPLCLACALACASRWSAPIGITLVSLVFLFTVPAVLEGFILPSSATLEGGRFVDIDNGYGVAMFYNRWGWGALIAMFAFLTPRKDDAPVIEVIVLGLLLSFLFWLKLSYFISGGAAALLYALLGPRPWRTLSVGVGVFTLASIIVSLSAQDIFGYARDLLATARVSGSRFASLAERVFGNMPSFLIVLLPVLLMAATRRLKAVDIWVAAVIVLGSIFVFNQNAQDFTLPTLLVVAAYAIWRLAQDSDRTLRLAAALAFALPAAVTIIDRSAGFLGQVTMTRREEARPSPSWASIPALKSVYVRERENALATIENASTPDERLAAFNTMAALGRRQSLRSAEYIELLMAGMDDIRPVLRQNESILVLDVQNPLPFLMGARPPKGLDLVLALNRTFSEKVHPEPQMLFGDADHVMTPKVFMEPEGGAVLSALYSGWLDSHYAAKSESRYWTRWSGRQP